MKVEAWRLFALAPFVCFFLIALVWSVYDLLATRKEEKELDKIAREET